MWLPSGLRVHFYPLSLLTPFVFSPNIKKDLYPFIFSTSLCIAAKNYIKGTKRFQWHLLRHDKKAWTPFSYTTQQTFAWSKQTIETLEKGLNYFQSYGQLRRSGVFVVNFEYISLLFLVSLLLSLSVNLFDGQKCFMRSWGLSSIRSSVSELIEFAIYWRFMGNCLHVSYVYWNKVKYRTNQVDFVLFIRNIWLHWPKFNTPGIHLTTFLKKSAISFPENQVVNAMGTLVLRRYF